MEKYIDEGFGFPVEIANPTFKKVFGKTVLDVNYKVLANMVFNQLVTKQGRFTGNELKYIVDKMELTTRDFAKPLGVSHAGVIKWQKKADKLTEMQWTIEKEIRIFIFEKFLSEIAEYNLSELRAFLYEPTDKHQKPICVDWNHKEIVLPRKLILGLI